MGAVTRPFMRRPDQGSLSAVWASVATEARSSEWRNGEYFTDPAEIGGESNETKDQEVSHSSSRHCTFVEVFPRFDAHADHRQLLREQRKNHQSRRRS